MIKRSLRFIIVSWVLSLNCVYVYAEEKIIELEPLNITADPLGEFDEHISLPVTVISGERLEKKDKRNIGEAVADELGVTSSDFGPNVGRPIIRGLGGARVRVLEDGIGALDVSTISVDHGVSIEPMFADQIEIFRGPATLLYGSGASGGIVNVVNNRILDYVPEAIEGDLFFDYTSVSDGKLGGGRLNAGLGNFAFHFDGFNRDTDDYDIPGFAARNPAPDDEEGELENSDVETENYGGGVSYVGEEGFIGLSITRFTNDYGIPGGHEEGDIPAPEEEGVRIDQDQTRLDFKAAVNDPLPWFRRFKTRWGYVDYEHRELESERQEQGTLFENNEWEGRAELVHEPIGVWDGVVGLQYRDREFSAVGEEAFLRPSDTRSIGGFLLEKGDWGRWHTEFGGRVEHVELKRRDGIAETGYHLFSVSGGIQWEFVDGYDLSVSITRAQRAPSLEELFADGPHLATNTFEIGNTSLDEETSNNFEASLHKSGGRWNWTLNLFANLIDDFIFLRENDQNGDGIADRVNEEGVLVSDQDGLLLVNNVQQDARFFGIEAETTFKLLNDNRGDLDLRVWGDYVTGELEGGEDLPRITPARIGGGLDYKRGPWSSGLDVMHVFEQNDTAMLETDTDGYMVLDLEAAYRLAWGPIEYKVFVRGTNLLNDEIRRHTSFLKDRSLLPGRSAVVGLRVSF